MAFHRNFLIIIMIIMLGFLIDKFQDTTTNNLNNLFLLETSQSQEDLFEIFERYFKQEQEQPSTELAVRPNYQVILSDVLYEMFSDEFLDQYWQKFAAAHHEPTPLIF
ncbi:hypothetical protein C1646_813860 [Rhizophagus diaphanus]|nr:hypothetical protein C1646_813860 [Rhizophagus diaphanus] [Rhizophagus sp. MUCL 43196]